MEEEIKLKELKTLSSNFSITNFLGKSFSSLCSGSLFSTIITVYALILLYFPSLFFDIVFSPVFISTGILLLALLRLGAVQRTEGDSDSPQESRNLNHFSSQEEEEVHDEQKCPPPNTNSAESSPGSDHKPYYSDSFREWNVRAPLEVIYEEYGEGEDDDDDDEDDRSVDGVFNEKIERRVLGIDEKYPLSLSKYYPESDGDSSSEDGDFAMIGNWESTEGAFFKWNDEDREELIEIALDGKRRNCGDDCHVVEEDSLIEIDIFPARGRYS